MAFTDGMELVALHERQGILVAAGYRVVDEAGRCVFRWSADGGATAAQIPGAEPATEVNVAAMDEEQPAVLLTPTHQVLIALTAAGKMELWVSQAAGFATWSQVA